MTSRNFDTTEAQTRVKITVPRVVRVKELSAILGVSEASIRRWGDEGEIPCARVHGVRLFVVMDVIRALRGRY